MGASKFYSKGGSHFTNGGEPENLFKFKQFKNDYTCLLPQAETPTWRTRDYIFSGPYPLICLTRVALPEAYSPASIALLVTGMRTPPLHDKAVVLEENFTDQLRIFGYVFLDFLHFSCFHKSRGGR
jgi:hypothetical protein